jgi:hypothetical protein
MTPNEFANFARTGLRRVHGVYAFLAKLSHQPTCLRGFSTTIDAFDTNECATFGHNLRFLGSSTYIIDCFNNVAQNETRTEARKAHEALLG